MSAVVTILVVDDHELLRFGLRGVLNSMGFDSLEIVEAATLSQALSLYEKHESSIRLVLLDLNLPDSKGLSALRAFKQRFPDARVVILSGTLDASIAEEARVLGAEHFLHKAGDLSLIGRVLSAVPHGPTAFGQPRPIGVRKTPQVAQSVKLSSREVEILELVLQGRSNQEICDATDLKLGTVKNYISGLLVVFGATSRSKLISLFR
jgi:DNA-binding NarL/FixJ family response regulator